MCPLLFIKVASIMPIIKFILISIFAHCLLMWVVFSEKDINMVVRNQELTIKLAKNSSLKAEDFRQVKIRKTQINTISSINPTNPSILKLDTKVAPNIVSDEDTQESLSLDSYKELAIKDESVVEDLQLTNEMAPKKYFSTNEVDIKALPISNLDASLVDQSNNSGLPVRLRIFIGFDGKVDSVLKLSANEQDEIFASEIQVLIEKITFLPARKDSVNVDSFQEVEFSFADM